MFFNSVRSFSAALVLTSILPCLVRADGPLKINLGIEDYTDFKIDGDHKFGPASKELTFDKPGQKEFNFKAYGRGEDKAWTRGYVKWDFTCTIDVKEIHETTIDWTLSDIYEKPLGGVGNPQIATLHCDGTSKCTADECKLPVIDTVNQIQLNILYIDELR
ncbi:uncharacterized protein L201_005322 [Kwoniella dendrophila CBS 6074]|uniref:Uncharacterized protein n=1 Tax=Kwoniella dendrophila CBS 6074 TaxID=1295534 RepID=A0AAX4K0W5_9TREE